MTRQIVSQSAIAGGASIQAAQEPDKFGERLLKLIPAEIVAAYVSIKGIIEGTTASYKQGLVLGVAVFLTLLTPVYLKRFSGVTKTGQIIYTTIGFVVWVFATGIPVKGLSETDVALIGSIALILYTLAAPFFYKGDS